MQYPPPLIIRLRHHRRIYLVSSVWREIMTDQILAFVLSKVPTTHTTSFPSLTKTSGSTPGSNEYASPVVSTHSVAPPYSPQFSTPMYRGANKHSNSISSSTSSQSTTTTARLSSHAGSNVTPTIPSPQFVKPESNNSSSSNTSSSSTPLSGSPPMVHTTTGAHHSSEGSSDSQRIQICSN